MSESHARYLLRQDAFVRRLFSSLGESSRNELWQALHTHADLSTAAAAALAIDDDAEQMATFAALVALGLARRNQQYLTLAARVDQLSFSLEDRYEAFMPRTQETGRERTADDDGP